MRSTIENSAVAPAALRPASAGSALSARLAAQPDSLRGKPSTSTIGLLVVALIIGYEWFISGLDKLARGDFPAGLGDELIEKSEGTADWYARFLRWRGLSTGDGPALLSLLLGRAPLPQAGGQDKPDPILLRAARETWR